MKYQLMNRIKTHVPAIAAFLALVFFTGNTNHDKNSVAANCCSGYNISADKLKQFMLDSLHSNQFEGGVYAKADLISAINKIPGDSLYIMNVLKNCSVTKPVDLAITSPTASGVVFTRQPNCYPCPGKPCCPTKVCVSRINRSCINYVSPGGFMDGSELSPVPAEE